MSNNPIARSFDGKEEMSESGGTQQPYQSQSAWMAHWMPRNYGLANGAPPPAPLSVSNVFSEGEGEEIRGVKLQPLLNWKEKGADASRFGDRSREGGKRKMMDTVSGSGATVGLERFRNEPSEGQPSLMLGCSRELEIAVPPAKKRLDSARVTSSMSRLDASSSRGESKLPGSIPWFNTSGMETRSSGQNSAHHAKCKNRLYEKNGVGLSMHSEDYFPGTSSQIVPYEFDSQRNRLPSSSHEPESLNRPSSFFGDHMKKMESNGALLGKNEARDFPTEQVLKMPPRYSDSECFSFQSGPSVPGMASSSAHDVRAMRVRTTIDSVTDFSAGGSKVLHTTHQFFITKKTIDLDLPVEGQMFQQSSTFTKFNGNSLDESFGLTPGHCSHGNQGVKLQPLESSRESKGKEAGENVETCLPHSKNNSSSETNTMDMDVFRQNRLCGLASPPSSKDMNGGRKLPISQDAMIASVSQEVRSRTLETQLPDINEEFHVPPDVPGTADGTTKQTSTSITQSLDGDCWPSLADNPANWKSSAIPDPVGLDPFSRWLKRLKPSAPDPVACYLGKASHEKVTRIFSKMRKCGQTSSEMTKISDPPGKDLRGNDNPTGLVRNTEPSFANSKGKLLDAMQSHPWIQRWCREPDTSPARKPDCVMASESRGGAKWGTADGLPRKQFPSIAAMALMGKAMTGFRPCEFRKRGSLILWSNKGY